MSQGQLRIYLGSAPGVGKTYAMLNEARRRKARGTDIVIAVVNTHDRPETAAQIGDLEIIPSRRIQYRNSEFEEMDVDAIIARKPDVAVVDELAHTNIPGSRNEKRWQDVHELLNAGIDVLSTVNIQHLESLNDVVEQITDIKQHETIPDAIVRSAQQVELVDQTPEALRRRMAHGNIYPPERAAAALANYFRPGNLGALRELALMWLADKVEEALEMYRDAHAIDRHWEIRERTVVALTGAPKGDAVLRRAARIAARSRAELIGVHVRATDGLAEPSAEGLTRQRTLLTDLDGTYREIASGDVARALVAFARSENATQIVLGASTRGRIAEFFLGSVIKEVIRLSGSIDVHVISTDKKVSDNHRLARVPRVRRVELPPRRRNIGWLVAIAGPLLATAALANMRGTFELPAELLLFLLVVVAAAAIGSFLPAILAAMISFALANWYFTPPLHRWAITDIQDLVSLVVFLVIAVIVSYFVAVASRRAIEAASARAEAETLAALAGTVASDNDPLPVLCEQLRVAFAADTVAVLREKDGAWIPDAVAGGPVPEDPKNSRLTVDLGPGIVLTLDGSDLEDENLDVLQAFSGQLAIALERRHLRAEAVEAERAAQANELRAGLLAAVSHDLRTPLASIKAAASSLRQPGIDWLPEDRDEFLATIESETDRLTDLVTNLLGMSRIRAGAVQLSMSEVGLEEVVPRAITGLQREGVDIQLALDESLPRVRVDAALLERAIANVVDNALKWSPSGETVRVFGGVGRGSVQLYVMDHGPGIPEVELDRIFEPFQRFDDRGSVEGTGLGLAVARGFIRLMGGELIGEESPGGGTTMVMSLPEVE